MKSKRHIIIGVFLSSITLLLMVVGSLKTMSNASAAAPTATELMNKTLINAMNWCYREGHIASPISTDGYFEISSIFTAGQSISVPTDIDNSLDPGTTIDCQQVFEGVSGGFLGTSRPLKGLLARFGKETLNEQLDPANLGYIPAEGATTYDRQCIHLNLYRKFADGSGERYDTNSVCLKVGSDGKIDVQEPWLGGDYTQEGTLSTREGDINLGYDSISSCINYIYTDATAVMGGNFPFCASDTNINGKTIDEVAAQMEETLRSNGLTGGCYWINNGSEAFCPYENGFETIDAEVSNSESSSIAEQMELDDYSALRTLRWLTNDPNAGFPQYYFTNDDWVVLYKSYYQTAVDDFGVSLNTSNCSEDKNAIANAMTSDGVTWCEVVGASNVNIQFGGRYNNKYLKQMSFEEILADLKELDWENVDDSVLGGFDGGNVTGGEITPPADPSTNDDASCFTNADSLGWIVCPALKFIGTTASVTYQYIVENWLEIKPEWLQSSDGQGAYEGWKQFRDFANIIFVIVFLVVIFSQVTGVGVSNYGIKKILPKLIIVAVLVNLSFLLCQIAIDLSNIVGAGSYNLFHELKTGTREELGLDNIVDTILGTLGTGAVAVGGGAALAVAIGTNPGGFLLAAIIALLGAVVSVFLFFLTLAVRSAGIIVLTVLAPVAIICYALPNTKSLFDKWRKIFLALLLLYPICGVMMGGGYFVSNLILKSGEAGFMVALVAMLLQVVPIFFIPGILRSSLALVGNIGARISTMGARFNARTSGAIRNSDAANRAVTSLNNWGATRGQQILGNVNTRLRNARGIGRLVRGFEDSRVGRALSAGQTRNVARNKIAYSNMLKEEAANRFIAGTMTQQTINDDLAAQQYKQEQELIERDANSIIAGNMKYVDSTTGAEKVINANDTDDLNGALEYYMNQYDTTGDEAILTRARAITKLAFTKGDKGQTLVTRQLKSHLGSGSFRGLSRYIARDDRWMPKIKTSNVGAFNMINDGAVYEGSAFAPTSVGALKSLSDYNTAKIGAIKASAVPDLSEDFLDSLSAEVSDVSGNLNAKFDMQRGGTQADVDSLLQLSDTLEQAMADPRIANQVNPEDLKKINEIHQAAYDARLSKALKLSGATTPADIAAETAKFEAEHGKYRKLEIGQQLKVRHATLPSGWRQATAADLFAHGNLNVGDWIDDTTYRKLNQQEIDRVKATEQYNIDADVKNSAT